MHRNDNVTQTGDVAWVELRHPAELDEGQGGVEADKS